MQLSQGGSIGGSATHPSKLLVVVLGLVVLTAVAIGTVLGPLSGDEERTSTAREELVPILDQQADSLLGQQGSGSTGGSDADVALRWLEGLASGTILRTDVTDRLHHQDPRLAIVVTRAWDILNEA